MKKIKVLMVAGSMHVGGIENQLMHLARNADKEKFQIDFTSTMKDAACKDEIETLGGKFLLIPDMDWKHPIKYCRAIYKVMKDGQYDIVHSHELFHSGITLWLAKIACVPCRFCHAHNWCDDDGSGRKRSLVRSVYNVVMRSLINKYSTIQIACSSWAGEFLYGQRVTRKSSYHVIFNSVDTTKFIDKYGQTESGEFCENGDWKNVINVARISAVKNQVFLTEIAKELKKRGDHIHIICVGAGDSDVEQAVLTAIRQNQLEDYIQLIGVRKDVDVLMRKSSAFILPSKYEGMPLVMIEAQASGLPCVSANTYSPEVDFGIGNVTWLSLQDNISVWANALENAVMKSRVPKTLVEKAIAEKGFDSKTFTKTLCKLYMEDYYLRKGGK